MIQTKQRVWINDKVVARLYEQLALFNKQEGCIINKQVKIKSPLVVITNDQWTFIILVAQIIGGVVIIIEAIGGSHYCGAITIEAIGSSHYCGAIIIEAIGGSHYCGAIIIEAIGGSHYCGAKNKDKVGLTSDVVQ